MILGKSWEWIIPTNMGNMTNTANLIVSLERVIKKPIAAITLTQIVLKDH